ncbi:Sec-independent protein translocase subunit TatB [Massilia sp. Dwa41.01b]|uniref:Sec-independent protein translocase protein TatB n=1 Tax=unclassified Massilia TaxID=2609279 RepID=UPI00160349A8|nr:MULTISPECIES: Sec-independent protein translocase protein TatB [unclassified Massilia]QNA87396.1 Sec-independent protein translocase subunit TatB [Massilia sp. Dwa41.01b]QNA98302.1 Sec-independent protein translocase subunit TatB [Massilia sp. Se16.2.3]
MIDLGLSKIAIIGVVALIVIGPEKLPKVARMAGTLYGRAQRYLHDVKSEVSRSIELDELRNLQKEVHESADEFRADVEYHFSNAAKEVESAWHGDIQPSIAPPSATVDNLERKAKDFRRKKLVRSSAIPAWYKHRHGGKTRVLSGAARVRKFRPGVKSNSSFF